MALSPKQRKFVEEYCICLNSVEAARKAGYSRKTCHVQGPRLLSNVRVKDEIAKRLSWATRRAEIQLDEVMAELRKLAFANISDFCSWGTGEVVVKPSDTLSPELLAAVESVSETQDKHGNRLIKVKLHSKQQALNAITRLYEVTELEARIMVLEERLGNNEAQPNSRLQKLEEALTRATLRFVPSLSAWTNVKVAALARCPAAETAKLVVFVEQYGAPGQGPPEEPEDLDAAIQAEIEGLKAHGYDQQRIEEAIKAQEAPKTSGVKESRRTTGSRRRSARPLKQDNGNGRRADDAAGQSAGLSGSSELTRLFGRR